MPYTKTFLVGVISGVRTDTESPGTGQGPRLSHLNPEVGPGTVSEVVLRRGGRDGTGGRVTRSTTSRGHEVRRGGLSVSSFVVSTRSGNLRGLSPLPSDVSYFLVFLSFPLHLFRLPLVSSPDAPNPSPRSGGSFPDIHLGSLESQNSTGPGGRSRLCRSVHRPQRGFT